MMIGDRPSRAHVPAWQPIATAPETRAVQLFKDGKQYVGTWAKNPWTGAVAWCIGELGEGNRALLENPTHWRELDAPPNTRDNEPREAEQEARQTDEKSQMTLEELRTWIAGSPDFDGVHQRAEACVTAAIRESNALRDAQAAIALYFTSGNAVPVERATIRSADFWRITGMSSNG